MAEQAHGIRTGLEVVTAGGEAIGTVDQVTEKHLVTGDMRIPLDAVSAVRDDRIVLAISKERLQAMSWAQPAGQADDAQGHEWELPNALTGERASVDTTSSTVIPEEGRDDQDRERKGYTFIRDRD